MVQPEIYHHVRPQNGGRAYGLSRVVTEDESSSSTVSSEEEIPLSTFAVEEEPPSWNVGDAWHPNHHAFFIRHIIYTVVILVLPWIFFSVVWHLGGIQLHGRVGEIIYAHPKDTVFVVTTAAGVVTFCINYVFTTAVTSLAQKWVVHRGFDVFRIAFFSSLRTHKFLWPSRGWRELLRPGRRLLVPMVVLFIVTFTFVASGITALLTPAVFLQTTSLGGKEVDFSTNDPDCKSWLGDNLPQQQCDWKSYKDSAYTTCRAENQLVDVLESGRGNILSLITNNSFSLTFPQLDGTDGLRFLGPIRGVLPIGQDGISAFNTIEHSPLSAKSVPADLPYNYTLDLQGLSATVTCDYASESPIIFSSFNRGVMAYQGTCPVGQQNISQGFIPTIINNNTLAFWSCKQLASDNSEESYVLHFRGWSEETALGMGYYADSIGNITCLVSPLHSAVFPTTYRRKPGVFVTANPSNSTAISTNVIANSIVMALGSVVAEAQNRLANLVAESVITFGVKSFHLESDKQDEKYLRLYEAMILGILEYEATYTRLLYSLNDVPQACTRHINGSAEYEVFGWSFPHNTAAFLIPMTLINLASLGILVYAMLISDRGPKLLPLIDPLDPEALIVESGRQKRDSQYDPAEPQAWKAKVVYARNEHGRYSMQLKVPGNQ